MNDLSENSAESVLDFAFQAAGADGTVSPEELSLLLQESNLVTKMISSLGLILGLSKEFLELQEVNTKNYLLKISTEDNFKFSKINFDNASQKITASTLQPFALAFARFVAAADGLDKREILALEDQKNIWGCEEEDLSYYIDQLTAAND